MMTTVSRICRHCGKDTPYDQLVKNKKSKDGVDACCKDCSKILAKKWGEKNPDKARINKQNYKKRDPERTKRQHAEHYQRHKSEKNEYRKRHYHENPEIREKELENAKEWRKKNESRIRGYWLKRVKNFNPKNKRNRTPQSKRFRLYVSHQRMRARKLNFSYDFTVTDWEYALEYFGDCCAICGRPQGFWHTIAMDHWIPIDDPKCPGTIPTNIIPLCHGIDGCNNKKHNKDAKEWLVAEFGKRKAQKILDRIQAYIDHLKNRSK